MGTAETREVRAAKNQSLFREINERIKALNEVFAVLTQSGEWVCECADMGCIATIEMTLAEYEAIRAHPTHFPVVPGHEVLDVEHVIDATDRFVVVEKIGDGARLAASFDPRG